MHFVSLLRFLFGSQKNEGSINLPVASCSARLISRKSWTNGQNTYYVWWRHLIYAAVSMICVVLLISVIYLVVWIEMSYCRFLAYILVYCRIWFCLPAFMTFIVLVSLSYSKATRVSLRKVCNVWIPGVYCVSSTAHNKNIFTNCFTANHDENMSVSLCNGSEPIREVDHTNYRVHVELCVNLSSVWNHRLVESQFVSNANQT